MDRDFVNGRPSRRSFLRVAGTGLGLAAWTGPRQEAVDVLVVGAGAVGATIAYFLRGEGLSVALLDRGPAGREASWASAGMIQPYGSSKVGAWPARASLLSRVLYDDLEPALFEETGRRIGYGGDGGMILAFDAAEADALERSAGPRSTEESPVRFVSGDEARTREPGLAPKVVAALLQPAHRCLDARSFTSVVVEAARKKGVRLAEQCPVTGLMWDGDRVVGVRTGDEKRPAGTVILAAGAWSGGVDPRLALPVRPVHGQVLAIEAPPGGLRHNLQRAGAGGYVTPRGDRVLAGATSDDFGFEKKVTPDGLSTLAAIVREVVPHLAGRKVLDAWSGLRPGSPDGLPAVGPDPRATSGFLWATGHGGYGMMQGPATAKVVCDLVLKRAPRIPIDSVAPSRLIR